ncbi:Shikimate kinase [Methylobacterium thuringiense]|uniref:Shikimate kinase n=2 Tax=Methylobacteriaceae TaxID=119045 RepID=A0ABQ4TJZ0_9HYPH|nr:Shikimate kinase [Methylobacterium thuringiense]
MRVSDQGVLVPCVAREGKVQEATAELGEALRPLSKTVYDRRMTDPEATGSDAEDPIEARIRRALGARSIVLVGLMGAGKSTVGRRLGSRLGLMFKDADSEIEAAANLTITDLFAIYGEASFREGEERVISRLLRQGPMVLATGGGAFMRETTRERITESAVSVWLRAELDVLMRRVKKRNTRPLLQTADPEATMRELMAVRHPVYGQADVMVLSREVSHDRVVQDVLEALDVCLNPPAHRVAAQ